MTPEHELKTLIAPGELRTDLLELFLEERSVDVLLAAPGLLPQPPAGHARLAREPHERFPAQAAFDHRTRLLEHFGAQLDSLPQSAEWEARIASWIQRIASQQARFLHYDQGPLFSRLVSRRDASVVPSGPITSPLFSRPPGSELDLTLAGEMHARARQWFQGRTAAAKDISSEVKALLEATWAGGLVPARDVYFKVLAEFFSEMLHGTDFSDANPMLGVMTSFQRAAYQQAKGILRRFGGVVLADVVGLGKTYIAIALLRYLQDALDQHAVVVAPPAVCPTWELLAEEFGVHLRVLSHGKLEELANSNQRQVLVLDESHNFRNPGTRRYERLWEWLHPDGAPSRRQVLLLSATPQNNSPDDVLQQLRLFPDNFTRLPYPGESLEAFFRAVEAGKESLTGVLQQVVVRRTRRFIETQYPDAKLPVRRPAGGYEWVPIRFPKRISGPEQCLRYCIEDVYGQGLYGRIIELLGSMQYPLHGIAGYALEMHKKDDRLVGLRQAGHTLRGLFKVLLLKRLESSETAFRISLDRLHWRLSQASEALKSGYVLLRREVDDEDGEAQDERMPAGMFDAERLRGAIDADLARVDELRSAMQAQTHTPDAKLARLKEYLEARGPSEHRTLIFTQFSDTAGYLAGRLREHFRAVASFTGSSGNARNIAQRFAPKGSRAPIPRAEQIELLVATDALSEGVNLQDADTLINYDLHWNPVRLIQRAGRIDRLGSEHEEIHVASFLPERGLESGLGLEQVLRHRIHEFLAVFGEDSQVLPQEEKLDETGAVDSYAGIAFEKAEAEDQLDAFGRHAERILTLQQTERAEFERIRAMRAGRRACTDTNLPPIVATRLGWYWGFWKLDKDDAAIQRVTDLQGLDLLYKHAQRPDAQESVLIAQAKSSLGAAVEDARRLFSAQAAQVREQRKNPALSAEEEWVRASLDTLKSQSDEERREELERAIRWLFSGQYKATLRMAASRWKKEKLSPEAVGQQMVGMLKFPLRTEGLGDEEVVAAVTGTRRATLTVQSPDDHSTAGSA